MKNFFFEDKSPTWIDIKCYNKVIKRRITCLAISAKGKLFGKLNNSTNELWATNLKMADAYLLYA